MSSEEQKDTLSLGERIRKVRRDKGLTQDDLARDIFSKSYVSAVELGKIQPSIKALRILARRLQHPLSYFVEALEPDLNTDATQLGLLRVRLLVKLNDQLETALVVLTQLDRERLSEQELVEILYLEAQALVGLERYPEALNVAQQSLAQFDFLKEPIWTEKARALIAEIYFRQSKIEQARELQQISLEAIRAGTVSDYNLKLAVYADLAQSYTTLDMHDAARSLFPEANQLALDTLAPQGYIYHLLSVASEQETEGHPEVARHLLEIAHNLLEMTETRHRFVGLYLVFGAVYLAGHNWQEAERCFNIVLDNNSAQLPVAVQIAALNNLAQLYLRQERLDDAARNATQAYHILQQNSNYTNQSPFLPLHKVYGSREVALAEVLIQLAQISEKQKAVEATDRYFQEAIDILSQNNELDVLARTYSTYGEMLLERGDTEKGANYYRLAYEAKRPNHGR